MAEPEAQDGEVSPADSTTFGLDEVIQALSADLKKAQSRAAKNKDPYGLYLGSAEVELQFTVQRTQTKGAGGKVSFKVFGIGAGVNGDVSAGSLEESMHRIKLTLIPRPGDEPNDPLAFRGTVDDNAWGFGTGKTPRPLGVAESSPRNAKPT